MFHRAPGSIGASSLSFARRQGHARGRPDGRRPRDRAQPEGRAGGRREQPARRHQAAKPRWQGKTVTSFTGSRAPSPRPRALSRLLAQHGQTPDAVIEIQVDDDALVKRIIGGFRLPPIAARAITTTSRCRRFRVSATAAVGPNSCGAVTIMGRWSSRGLRPITPRPKPLINYYQDRGKLKSVNSITEIGAVHRAMDEALDGVEFQARQDPRLTLSSGSR